MIRAGWMIYAAVYMGFAFIDSRSGLIAIFLAYGLYFGLTEPAGPWEKEYVGEGVVVGVIEAGGHEAPVEIDASGGIVMPGMIDTHRHLWQTAMRGYGADWTLTFRRLADALGFDPGAVASTQSIFWMYYRA